MMDRRGKVGQIIRSGDKRVQQIMNQRIKDKQTQKFFSTQWTEGPAGKKRPITDVLSNGAWKRRRCFVVAGGPSLIGFDWSLLDNELTIGINRAYEVTNCDILFFMDAPYYRNIQRGDYGPTARKRLADYQGVKAFLDLSNQPVDEVFYMRSLGRKGISYDLELGIYHGNNSGYGALNLAIALGANPIYLLGYDMKFDGAKTHFHDGHFVKGTKKKFTEGMMKSFPLTFGKVAGDLLRGGHKIINVNRESKLRCFQFGNLPKDMSKKKRPVFVSYYTRNTGYIKEYRNLRDSLWRHNVRFNIQEIESLGSWVLNCGYKPVFIKEMMDKYPENPIVWVDVDAVVKQKPDLFDNITEDFGCHFRTKVHRTQHDSPEGELLSGTLYFSNSKASGQLVDSWIKETKANLQMWDQQTLRRAWDKWGNTTHKIGNTTYKLPISYCQIFDGKDTRGIKPVILHFQKSREYKKYV